jgi:NADP-dependent alcohol dehydrogenase
MNNFVYYNPVKILFGAGQIEKISKEIPSEAKILMLYGGGSIKSNGVYDQVKIALEDFDLTEFGGIEPNPTYETLMEAVKIVNEKNIDFLLAVGGGSVIDGTKFVAAAAKYQGDDPWDLLSKGAKVKDAVSLATVLTLPATGSEVNGNSVISRKSTQEKLAFGHPRLFPVFSVLDPQVVASLPERQVRNGIVDAYIHVIEQYLTYPVHAELQDKWAESILTSLIEIGPEVLKSPDNYHHAANLMWLASMALGGIIKVGCPEDWSTHMIGHELTAMHGVDHALSLAIVLPGVMDEMREEKREKLLQYAERIWGIRAGDDDERIDEAIKQTNYFFQRLGMETRLSDHNIGHETIDEIQKRFESRPGFDALSETETLTPERVKTLLESRL